jgi:trigger factor
MQISVESMTGLERKMTVTLPSEELTNKVNQRLQKLSKTVKLDGFRPGKVPHSVLKERYEPAVRGEAISDLIQDSYFKALQEEKIKPAGYPKIAPEGVKDGDTFSYEAVFEVFPEIKLVDFAKIKLEKLLSQLESSDVDNAMAKLVEQRATWVESEGPAENGDRIELDYSATLKKKPVEEETREAFALTIGSGIMPEGFEDALVGQSTNTPFDIKLKLPKDYANEALQGKTLIYTVTIKKTEKKTLPELNDDLLKEFGIEEGGIDALKAEIKKNLEHELKYGTKNLLRKRVVDALMKAHAFDVPQALIEEEAKRLREQSTNYFKSMQPNQTDLKLPEMPLDLFKKDAEKQVQTGLLFAEVIQVNDIKVSEELLAERIADLVTMYDDAGQAEQYIRSNKQQLEQVKAQVLDDQIVNLVLDSAKITEKTVSFDELTKVLQEK